MKNIELNNEDLHIIKSSLDDKIYSLRLRIDEFDYGMCGRCGSQQYDKTQLSNLIHLANKINYEIMKG